MTITRTALLLVVALTAGVAHAGELEWSPKDNKVVTAYNAGVGLLNDGVLGGAEAKFRRALKLQPDLGPALRLLGNTLFRLDRPDEAIPLFQRIADEAPDHPEVLPDLAMALFATQRFEEAQAVASRAVDAVPEGLDSWNALVLAELRLGTYERIAARLQAAREAQSADAAMLGCFAAWVLVELDDLEAAEAAMKPCRDAESEALVANAEAALAGARGDTDLVTRHAEEVGDDPTTALNHGVKAYNAGDFAAAEALASRSIKLGYPTPAPVLLRAQARYELGKGAAARKDLHSVLGDDGSWVRVSTRGALTGVLTKAHEESLRLRMQGGAATLVMLHVDDGKLDDAARAVADARSAFGDFPLLMAAESLVLRERGEQGKAWELLARAAQGETNARVLNIIGNMAWEAASTASDDVVRSLIESGVPSVLYNLAAGSAKAKMDARCQLAIDGLLADPGTNRATSPEEAGSLADLLPKAIGLGYDCAIGAGDLEAADRYGARASWTDLQAWSVAQHAQLLFEAGRGAEIVAHVERSGAAEGEHAGWVIALIVRALSDRGDLDAVARWGAHPSAEPTTQFNAGTALAMADRSAEAKALLEPACAALEEDGPKEAAESCATNLEIVNRKLGG